MFKILNGYESIDQKICFSFYTQCCTLCTPGKRILGNALFIFFERINDYGRRQVFNCLLSQDL